GTGSYTTGSGGRRVRVEGFPEGFEVGDLGDLGDLFGGLFGGGGRRGRHRQPARGADLQTEVTLSFEEAMEGTTVPIQVKGPAPQPATSTLWSTSGRTGCSVARVRTSRSRCPSPTPNWRWVRRSTCPR